MRATMTTVPSSLGSGWLAGLFAVACWSGFIIVSRIGGQSELLPTDILALRFGIAAVLFLPFVRTYLMFDWRGLTLALVGGLGYSLLAYLGFRYTSALHAAVMLPGLIPFSAALLSMLVLGERFARLRQVGFALIAAGVLMMLFASGGGGHAFGDVLLAAAAVCWALYTVLIRRWQVPPLRGAVTLTLLSALLYLPLYSLWLPAQIMQAGWSDIVLQGIYQGLIAAVLAMLLYLHAVATIGPSAMGALMALVPAISSLAALLMLAEHGTGQTLLAVLLTSAGALLASGIVRARRSRLARG